MEKQFEISRSYKMQIKQRMQKCKETKFCKKCKESKNCTNCKENQK